MSEINLKDIICPAFYPAHKEIKSKNYIEYWFKGGRGSTKSSFISIEFVLGIIKNPNMHGICFRKVGNKLEKSVYNQLIWAIKTLNLQDFFKFRKCPLEIEYKPTGQLILFRGLDDPDNTKSIKLPFGYIGLVWFEEAKQFDGMKEIRNVKQSVIRGGDNATIFFSYNPPEEPRNWVNKEARRKNPHRYIHHSTYLDVNPEWLGNTFFIEAEELKNSNPLAYQNEYLGEEVGTGLTVFTNVHLEEITDKQIKSFDNVCEGIDWGYSIDPFVFLKIQYERKYKTIYIFDEIYKVGLSNEDAIEEVSKIHCRGVVIKADSEEPKSIDDFDNAGVPIEGAKKGAGSVSYGIKRLKGLHKIIIDPERCPNAAREFVEYSLELNKDETIKTKYPDKDNHTIDATRYALEEEFEY